MALLRSILTREKYKYGDHYTLSKYIHIIRQVGAALPLISNKGFVSINGVIQEPPLNFDFNETIGDGDEGGGHRNRLDAGQAPTRTTTFAGWMLPSATQISQSQSFSLEILAERSTSKTSSSTAPAWQRSSPEAQMQIQLTVDSLMGGCSFYFSVWGGSTHWTNNNK